MRNSKNVLSDRAARNTYLTRYDIIIFIHIHTIIMYTEGGGAFRRPIMFFCRLHFFSAHLGVNGFFNRRRCRRHHPKFHCVCAFLRPPGPCEDNDDVTTTRNLRLPTGSFIFVYLLYHSRVVVYVYTLHSVYTMHV